MPEVEEHINRAVVTAAAVVIGGTAITFGLTSAAAIFAANFVFHASVSYALDALTPKPKLPDFDASSSRGYQINGLAPAGPTAVIYGKTKVGGVEFYRENTNNNKFYHFCIALAGHEVNAIETVFFNDDALTINASGYVVAPSQYCADGTQASSKARIIKHLGAPNQAADSSLVSESAGLWTSDHRARGVAYIYIRLESDADVFPNGVPTVTAVVEGKKVYNPATNQTAYSNNSALILRDYLTEYWGVADSDGFHEAVFSTAQNICDENVSLSGGGTQKRYPTNGTFTTDADPKNVSKNIIRSMGGMVWNSQGKWGCKAAAYTAPILTLTESDFRSSLKIQTRHSQQDSFNQVIGIFRGPESNYQQTNYPAIKSDVFLETDNNIASSLELNFPFVDNPQQAQRIAKIALYRNREQLKITGSFGLKALKLCVGDLVNITNERLGFDEKTFEIIDWRIALNENMALECHMTLQEISAGVFSWDAEEQEFETNNTNLASPFYVPPIGFETVEELREVNEQVFGVISVNVTTDDPLIADIECQYKKVSDPDYKAVGKQYSNFEILALQDGVYDIRVRAINQVKIRGDWVNRQVDLKVFAPPPENVSNFFGNVVGNTLHLTWSPVTDLDLSYYKIRYSTLTTGATYSNAVDLVDKVARPANSITVPARTGTYFIKAVDKLGGLSVTPASFVVLIDPKNIESFNAVVTVTEHPNFNGSRSDTVVLSDDESNYLALDTSQKFDSGTGNFDDGLGLFDGGRGSIVPSGVYNFSNSIDLGEKYTSRVKPTFKVDYLDHVYSFDSTLGLFDDRSGNFDGDPDQFDTTSATIEIRTTDDDPSGSPIWSEWQKFIVADISARAMQFRAVLTSSSPSATPAIRELSAEIDMPERVESEQDITFTGTKNVTFPTAFKDTPALGIALVNLADGERYLISSKSRTGFTIQILNGVSQSTNSVTLDYVAKGYGKEIT